MQYMILAVESTEDFGARQDPGRADGYWAAWRATSPRSPRAAC